MDILRLVAIGRIVNCGLSIGYSCIVPNINTWLFTPQL
nr:MAG TPA: hypothetical protein [Caudoviricetes sp.]